MEIWKDIEGFEGRYQASNLGRIKSLRKRKIRRVRAGYTIRETMLRQFPHKSGYFQVFLYGENKPRCYQLHRVIAMAFVSNPDNKPEVNHIDGDKSNNASSNLEWVTASENIIHARDNGLCGYCKINKDIAEEIRVKFLSGKYTRKQLSISYKIEYKAICKIIAGKIYN